MADKVKLDENLIYGFVNSLLAPRFHDPVATPDFHLELWKYMCLDDKYVAIAAPRGHAKSTAVTHAFTLASICFRQASHVLLVSDTEAQSIQFLGDIKMEIVENEALRALFGIKGLRKDRETEIVVEFNDGHLVRLLAKGSEQKLRGIKWRNMRPDLIVCDDLENDEIVMNDDRRYKFKRWFLNALLPCGSKNCKVRVVGTILHMDSLLENLMPEINGKYTIVEELKDTSFFPKTWKSVRYRAHNEDFSRILWEEQWSEERLKRERLNYVEQGFPEGYSQEYLNYPLDDATAYFQKDDLLPITEEGENEVAYISADLAISEKDRRAYTVFAVATNDPKNTLRVRHISRFRGDSLRIVDEMFALWVRFKPEVILVEQENIARTLGPIINKEMEERGIFMAIKEMTASQDKIKRARALQNRVRAGKVQFDKEKEWYMDLQNELLQFPVGTYKDQVDALSWIALYIDKIYEAPTNRMLSQWAYEDELEETSEYMYSGSSSITGY